MHRYQILIEYVGTNFVGWQIQSKGRSIQKSIKIKLAKLLKEKISLVGFYWYEKNDLRQEDLKNAIAMYKKNEKAIDLVPLTPASYQVAKSSIYAPK